MSESADWVGEAVGLFGGMLTQYARHLLGDLDRARDVVQETFIALCSAPRRPRGSGDPRLKAWLFTVCRRKALDVLRKERRMEPLTEDHEAAAPDPARAGDGPREELLAAVEKLPPNQREVIRLKFLHGHSYREISEITRLTEGNIGFLIHTGLGTLRRRLGPIERSET